MAYTIIKPQGAQGKRTNRSCAYTFLFHDSRNSIPRGRQVPQVLPLLSSTTATTTMTWVPDKSRMDALIGMLASSVSPDSASQKAAYDFVESNATNTEFIRYLVYAFVFGAELPSDQRAVAASLSKSLMSSASY